MENNENEVIIIGGDHHNTLSVIRGLGKRKVKFIVLVHEDVIDIKQIMISHSKYCKNIYLIESNESKIIEWLLNNKPKNRQIIIPCSDLAEYAIDNNYEKLKKYYIIPGFKNKPGKVKLLMNKYEQKKWADENNIMMAKSWQLNINSKSNIPKDIVYPCIIKPNISAYGKKSDITICKNKDEFEKAVNIFKEKKYHEVIVQQFLKKKYEICALGAVINSTEKYCGGIIKKDRENPPFGGGSLTFAHFIDKPEINLVVNNVIDKLHKEGYRGLYDIEFLVCEDNIYLNEINFRNSGNNYALLKNGIEAPYIFYLNQKNISFPADTKRIRKKNMYFMDELNEISLLKKGYINVFTFISDLIKASSYAKINHNDLNILKYYLIKISKRNKKNEKKK